jgi:hypothetical protein
MLARERRFRSLGGVSLSRREVAMSESDQFRQYADEALRWVAQSKTEEEKRLLFELALTWTQAAFATDHIGSSAAVRQPRAP